MIKKILFFICCLIVLVSCEQRFDPDINSKPENLLVIEGMITSNPGPYTIRISSPSNLIMPKYNPLSGYRVSIMDNAGTTETLIETNPGEYVSSADGIQGIEGRSYKINIQSPEGEIYESDYELLKNAGELESVYAQIEYREAISLWHDIAGYQFYLNSTLPEDDNSFVLWKLKGTYQYQSDFTIRWIWAGTLEWFYHPDSLYNCYKSDDIDETFVLSTEYFTGKDITAYRLHFVDTETRKLSVRYSLLVQQLSISEDAYHYWKGISDLMNGQNILNVLQPYQVTGNIKNIRNNEPVLGYFLTAGISEKRIFVDRPLYPVKFHYPFCVFGIADAERYWARRDFPHESWPLYAIETPGGIRGIPNQNCVDCRRKGGTIVIPDFWVN